MSSVVFRAFEKNHVAEAAPGHRLNSAFFRSSQPLSVYLGETPIETISAKHPGMGIAAIPVAVLDQLGLTVEPDPEPHPDDLPTHRVVRNNNRRAAAVVAGSAEIRRKLDGYQVVGASGTTGD